MKIRGIFASVSVGFLMLTAIACKEKTAEVNLQFDNDYAGQTLDLITFNDSTVLATAQIQPDGTAKFKFTEGKDTPEFPILAQFVVDGRVKGFYVLEEGQAHWNNKDNSPVAIGTPMNEKFAELLHSLDAADEAEDFAMLTAIAEKQYNENKDNIFGPYFGVEWLKWADPLKVDSLLKEAPSSFKDSKRAERYIKFAKLRAATSPGRPYVDFAGKNAKGEDIKLSDYVSKEGYTLIDFMASWCPYCIKDLPKIKDAASKYAGKNLKVVSVAVRDTPEDTKGAVEKHDITWDVVYDAQKRPYDLYGFSGIPHYILIGPDGKIVARSQTLDEVIDAIPQ